MDYVVYDVFSDKPFGGNQLAVFPDATSLPEDHLQLIAREFNFSEVTFVYPPASSENLAKVRIFTPTLEIPFAGHPTIGTTIALHDLGRGDDFILELGVGPIACRVKDGQASFDNSVPLAVDGMPSPALVAECLNISVDDIVTETHPPVMAGVGLSFVMVEIGSNALLNTLSVNSDAMRRGKEQYPSALDFAVFVYTRDGSEIHARMFAPLDNIPEDPATGSACAGLAALLQNNLAEDVDLTIHQGEAMGRPSLILAQASDKGVTISGSAIKVMQGTLVKV